MRTVPFLFFYTISYSPPNDCSYTSNFAGKWILLALTARGLTTSLASGVARNALGALCWAQRRLRWSPKSHGLSSSVVCRYIAVLMTIPFARTFLVRPHPSPVRSATAIHHVLLFSYVPSFVFRSHRIMHVYS